MLTSLDTKFDGKTSELTIFTQEINERLTSLEAEFDEDDEEEEEYEPANIMDSQSNPTTMNKHEGIQITLKPEAQQEEQPPAEEGEKEDEEATGNLKYKSENFEFGKISSERKMIAKVKTDLGDDVVISDPSPLIKRDSA